MVTITIDQGSGFEKTHFKNREELMAYLYRPMNEILSEFDSDLEQELDRRDKELDANPSNTSTLADSLEFARTGK